MTTDTIKQLGAEFHHAADGVGEALQRLEHARADRLAFLRQCSKDSTARLATLREEVRTLPEQIAKWDAEAARLESQTAEDLLRQALEPVQEQPQPESYRAGLPPERLRKVWAEWEMADGVVYVFRGNKYRCAYRPPTEWWDIGAEHTWRASYRPHGKTWAEVESMADAAEKPTLLDLTKLPPGTVCEALGVLTADGKPAGPGPGERFRIEFHDGEVIAVCGDERSWLDRKQPARVVEQPKGAGQ